MNEAWGWSVSDLRPAQLRKVSAIGMGRYAVGCRKLVFGELLLVLGQGSHLWPDAWILSGSDKTLFVMDPREVIDWTEPVNTGEPECSDAA